MSSDATVEMDESAEEVEISNPQAPFLCMEGGDTFLADPFLQQQIKIPRHHAQIEGGLTIRKHQASPTERLYVLDSVNPESHFKPRYVHILMNSQKAVDWTSLA